MKPPFAQSRLIVCALLGVAFMLAGCSDDENSAPVPTSTPTFSSTPTFTSTPTAIPTSTPSSSPTLTTIPTYTPTRTNSPTPTETPTITTTPTVTPIALSGHLDLDIRWAADVVIRIVGDDVAATMTLNDSREVVAANVALNGAGKLHRFPEVDAVLYSAKVSAPAFTDGRCGSQPVSLALTLLRRGENDHVGGGIAVYCGADTYSGNPARMLRLAGLLPMH